MKKKIVVSVLGLLLVGGYVLKPKANVARELSSVTSEEQSMICSVKAVLKDKSQVLVEERILSEKSLTELNEYEIKGAYFAIQTSGGFRVYNEKGETYVEVEAEGLGVVKNKVVSGLPFKEDFVIEMPYFSFENSTLDVVRFLLECRLSRTPHLD